MASSGLRTLLFLSLLPFLPVNTQVGSGACGINSYYNGSCQCPPGFSFKDPNNSFGGCKQDFPTGCTTVPAVNETTKPEDLYELKEVQGVNFPFGDYESFETYNQTQCGQSCLHDWACTVAIFNGQKCWKKKLPLSNGKLEGGLCIIKVRKGSAPGGSGKTWQWIAIATAIFLLVLVVGIFCYLRMRKRKLEEDVDSLKNAYEVEDEGIIEGRDLKIFSFESIAEATNNFSEENKLGEGDFGLVYKGKLQEQEIAVKRLSRASWQGLVEFKNELILISNLQHMNLVRVLGSCIHGEEKMLLIYEYLPNKSLDFFIFDPTKRELLDWKTRWNIIDGIAQGLLYLHKYSRMKVIHRDLKASNVLLDEKMNAKISGFGVARILKQNMTEANTSTVVGTYGYMAPEYLREGTFSVKSDIFSFGVLILEIVSGRRNTSSYDFDNRTHYLIGHAWELQKEGSALELKDPTLRDSCDLKQLERIIHVGFLCVQESATERPTIVDVISMLSNETMALPAPKIPAFFTGKDVPDDCSKNDLTISTMETPI